MGSLMWEWGATLDGPEWGWLALDWPDPDPSFCDGAAPDLALTPPQLQLDSRKLRTFSLNAW